MAIKRRVGQIVRINLYNGYFNYGYEINNRHVAVLDIMTADTLSTDDIMRHSRLFTVGVLDIGFVKWKKIGDVDLDASQRKQPDLFIQDSIDLSLQIIDDIGETRSATFEEVQGLERAVGWDNYQVEQRVRDHFANKTNIMVEILRPKPPNAPHYTARNSYDASPGAIKQIDLKDGTYVYARELQNTFFAVYDSRTERVKPPEEVIKLPVLFTVSASLSARIGWKSVDFIPLQTGEHPLPTRYVRFDSKPTDIWIFPDPYDPDFRNRKGTIEEAKGLEPAIMWDNYQVENRIRAYYLGKPWDLEIV
jgi:hypothetical protein